MIECVTWYLKDVEALSKKLDTIALVEKVSYAGNTTGFWSVNNWIVCSFELLQAASMIGVMVSDEYVT